MDYESFSRQFHIRLNPQQEEAVRAVEGNVLLLAVPGSGKTTVLITRLGYMIRALGIPADRILAMTYTVAAARDMKRRYREKFGEDGLVPEFRTINGVCARIIRTYEDRYNTEAFRLMADEGESDKLLTPLIQKATGRFVTDSDLRDTHTAITYIKNRMIPDDRIREDLPDPPEGIEKISADYKKLLREKHLMDYDDQMVYALGILRRCPDILNYYREHYRYICVDEAQDTSKIQHRIIDLLAAGGSLFMVGDEDQSIYGFRAAWPEALLKFEKNHPGARVLLMEENYRSTDGIVSAADAFIRKNTDRHAKSMTAVRGAGETVHEIRAGSRRAQYEYLAKVAESCDRETAVLFRDNECALPLIDLLNRRGLPYRCRHIDTAFFSHRVVKDLEDIILYAQNPTDGARFLEIYYKFNARISRLAAETAVRQCNEDETPLDYIIRKGAVGDFVRDRCRDLRHEFRKLTEVRADDAVYRIAENMGYKEYLKSRSSENSAGKLEILQALGIYEAGAAGLLRRLGELEQIVASEPDPAAESRFILSTVHSSKGLEYDRVYLMDVYDGLLPRDHEGDAGILEEERRIFYVAMTRAKNELNIFTFADRQKRSSFSDAVFGREKTVKLPGSEKAGVLPPKKAALQPARTEAFAVGDSVKHAKLGTGRVIGTDGLFWRIDFGGKTGVRNISKVIAAANKLLEKL